jgi:DNA-binding CsgD family transcriptional regulator
VSNTLTPRQLEILHLVAEGKTSKEIAEILALSSRTVDVHMDDLIQRLGACNRPHAVAIALRKRIIK